jgi:hypothetical protein
MDATTRSPLGAAAWRSGGPLAAMIATALLAAGCATTRIDAQWRDPQVAPLALQGRTVLVLCRGPDVTLERVCEDRLADDARAIGAAVVRAEAARDLPADGPARDEALAQAGRAAGAHAVLAMSVMRMAAVPAAGGPSVGVGIGGGSGGRIGGSVGIALPIGGAAAPPLGASATLSEVAGGRLLWSARLRSTARDSDAVQIAELSRAAADSLKAAALF